MKRSRLAALTGALTLLLAAGPALAHSDLVASTPADGATVTAPMAEIELAFSAPVEVGFSLFKVYPLAVDLTATTASPPAEGRAHADDEGGAPEGGEHDHEDADAHSDDTGHGAEAGSLHARLDAAAEALVAEALPAQDDFGERLAVATRPEAGATDRVVLTLAEELQPGAYVVMWRVLSADGHSREGFLTFVYLPQAPN